MTLNWKKEHHQMRDEEGHTLCPMRSAWALLRGLLASSLVARGHHFRLPSSLAGRGGGSVTFTLPVLPPCFCPFLLPKEKQNGAREDEGGLRGMVGSSGLSLRDGWFYPNAINSPAPRVHALRVKLTLVHRSLREIRDASSRSREKVHSSLASTRIEESFRSTKSMAAMSCRIGNNVPAFWTGSIIMYLHSGRIKWRSSRQKKQKCTYLRGRDLIICSRH